MPLPGIRAVFSPGTGTYDALVARGAAVSHEGQYCFDELDRWIATEADA